MRKNSLVHLLLCGAAMTGASSLAHAQNAAPAAQTASNAQNGTGIADIVVTAQRRSETAQKLPLSIEVMSADKLREAGVTQAVDLSRVSPGVQIAQGGTAVQVFIRGAGTPSTTPLFDPAVSLNIDGVYQARSQSFSGQFFDMDRVEVLKGPQGTLYGRNSSGGALNLVPTAPVLGQTTGYVQLGVQSYAGVSAEGAVNLPITDTLAIRAAGQIVHRNGYLSGGTDDDSHQSARVQLLFKPSSAFSLRIWGNYQHLGGKGPGTVSYDPSGQAPGDPGTPTAVFAPAGGWVNAAAPSNPWTSAIPVLNERLQAVTGGLPITFGPNGTTISPSQDINSWDVHAQADVDVGFGTLTVIPAYQKLTLRATSFPGLMYTTVTYVPGLEGEAQTSEATSVEARISDKGNIPRFTYTFGVFYYAEDQTNNDTVALSPVAFTYSGGINTRSYAAFGQVSYELFDHFKLIGGIRYTDEQHTVVNGVQYLMLAYPSNAGAVMVLPEAINTDTWYHRVNYRAGAEYQFTPSNMVYASVATGFKAGGQAIAVLPAYQPEDLTAYTIGTKNQFFGGRLQANLELFWWKYKNKQEALQELDELGNAVSAIINAGSATSKGVDLELTGKLTRHDTLSFNIEYNHAHYDSFDYISYGATPTSYPSTGCSFLAVGPTGLAGSAAYGFAVNCTGMMMARSPEWSGSASYTHDIPLASGAHIALGANATFSSGDYIQAQLVSNSWMGDYVLVNLDATYTAPKNAFAIDLFVSNLTNKAVYTGGDQSPILGNLFAATIMPPRVFGGRIRVNF